MDTFFFFFYFLVILIYLFLVFDKAFFKQQLWKLIIFRNNEFKATFFDLVECTKVFFIIELYWFSAEYQAFSLINYILFLKLN